MITILYFEIHMSFWCSKMFKKVMSRKSQSSNFLRNKNPTQKMLNFLTQSNNVLPRCKGKKKNNQLGSDAWNTHRRKFAFMTVKELISSTFWTFYKAKTFPFFPKLLKIHTIYAWFALGFFPNQIYLYAYFSCSICLCSHCLTAEIFLREAGMGDHSLPQGLQRGSVLIHGMQKER